MAIFGLEVRDFIPILALCIAGVSSALTAVIFLITYGRNRKSEQIKIAREIADKIEIASKNEDEFTVENNYPNEGSSNDKIKWINNDLLLLYDIIMPFRYFSYLVEQKEIDDKSVLNYYRDDILEILNQLEHSYNFIEEERKADPSITTPHEMESFAEIRRELLKHKKVWEQK